MFKLNVTQRDIDNGERFKPKRCALALAAKHHWLSKILTLEAVCVERIVFSLLKRWQLTLALTAEAAAFVRAFDQRRPVAPAKIRLGKLSVSRYTE